VPRGPRQRPLSIFLIKEEIGSYEDVVRDPESVTWFDIDRKGGVSGVVVLRSPTEKRPWWAQYLEPHLETGDALNALANASTAALLLIKIARRYFALAFGYGRHLLKPDTFEQDFGLKVVLNTVNADRILSVDARTFDELTMHTRRDVSQGSPFSAFGLDVTRDLVRAVTGSPRDSTLGNRASGSDALALLSRAQVGELPGLCTRLLEAYMADDYKEHFAWIDHLHRVRDPSVIARLNAVLLEAIRTQQLVDLHLAPPEPLPWSRIAGFTFSTRNQDELDSDPRITSYLNSVDSIEDLELGSLKRDRVIAVSADTDQPLDDWSIFNCLVYEVREDDRLYVLTVGQWYSVSTSFADDVLGFAADLPELDLELPEAVIGVREEDYNRAAAEAIGALCLDQQLIETRSGDRIELCDLLTADRQLVHVKKRGSSSTLSHLFSQGLVSAELLARESTFRIAARQIISALDSDFDDLLPDVRPERDLWEVGFVVLSRSHRETPLTLPFFSLVNLRSAVLRLQDLGFRASVRRVQEQ
jgi:uncharacterized protein (TIGR04141 family)